jgi:hypothetical protein
MDTQLGTKAGELRRIIGKRRCLLWAQAQGFPPAQSGSPRAVDIAPSPPIGLSDTGVTAIFECGRHARSSPG